MPSQVALFLFIVFIFWLFRRNARECSGVSLGIWVPVLWVSILASRPIGYWFSGQMGDERNPYVDGSPVDRMVFLILLALGLWILVKRRADWKTLLRENPWLWLFYLFCGLSVLWADYPFVSFKRWVKEIGNFIMILVVLTEKDRLRAFREVLVRSAFLLVPISVLVIKYYVEIGMRWSPWTGESYFCGITNNKNTLGRLAFVSVLTMLWSLVYFRKERGWRQRIKEGMPEFLVLLMSLWLLDKSESSTSVVCVMMGGLVLFAGRLRFVREQPVLVGGLACAALVSSLLILGVPELRQVVANALGRDITLTDRTIIWDRSLELGTDPFLGAGFSSVWTTPAGIDLREDMNCAHSHNGYLETYLNCGLIGLILLLGVVFAAGRNCLRQLSLGKTAAPLLAAFFFTGAVYNYTEVGFNNMTLVGFTMWLAAVFAGHRRGLEVEDESPTPGSVDTGGSDSDWVKALRLS